MTTREEVRRWWHCRWGTLHLTRHWHRFQYRRWGNPGDWIAVYGAWQLGPFVMFLWKRDAVGEGDR